MRGHLFCNQGLSINRASILFFMGANIRIKYEIALSRVQFTLKIALYSVQFANIYKVVAIKYLEKQIWFFSYAAALVLYVKNPNS